MFSKYFLAHQQGFITNEYFRDYMLNERTRNIELSKLYDVENTFTAGIDTMHIDPSECRYLLSGCADGSVFIHDLYNFTGKAQYTAQCICRKKRAHIGSIESATWIGPDNGLFGTSSTDRFFKLWDANTFSPTETILSKGKIFHHSPGRAAGWETTIAVGNSTGVVELIDLRTGSSLHQLRGHQGPVLATAWSPIFGFLLATSGGDGRLFLWDVRAAGGDSQSLNIYGEASKGSLPVAHNGLANGLVFTANGLFIVSFGTDCQLRLWDTYDRAHLCVNYGRINNNIRRHVQLAVSSTCYPQVIVPNKGGVSIMDLCTGELVKQVNGHYNRVNCCTLREPYQELFTGSNDRNIIVWSADKLVEEDSVKTQELAERDYWSSGDEI